MPRPSLHSGTLVILRALGASEAAVCWGLEQYPHSAKAAATAVAGDVAALDNDDFGSFVGAEDTVQMLDSDGEGANGSGRSAAAGVGHSDGCHSSDEGCREETDMSAEVTPEMTAERFLPPVPLQQDPDAAPPCSPVAPAREAVLQVAAKVGVVPLPTWLPEHCRAVVAVLIETPSGGPVTSGATVSLRGGNGCYLDVETEVAAAQSTNAGGCFGASPATRADAPSLAPWPFAHVRLSRPAQGMPLALTTCRPCRTCHGRCVAGLPNSACSRGCRC